NDDWGFNTATLLSHADLKRLVYPYYKQIAAIAHGNGQYCVMHSCGNFDGIFEDLYNEIGFDGKHSNEDSIMPVEETYRRYHKHIAVLGGMDVAFLTHATTTEIEDRCKKMLKLAERDGAYALGTGNSLTPYIPLKNYLTLLKCANP
ncbi:MAG: uroporphyrinogen decarboxylase family protein, partial [Firmicutes bacterium]|nr:uroporphyrinogen decarboxylase family protein [Bacillota bacterium]